MSLCKDCTKKDACTSLCPEAALYVNQDWVNLRELTVGLNPIQQYPAQPGVEEKELADVTNAFFRKSRKEQVVTLLEAGLQRKEIAQILGITRNNLRAILYRIAKNRYKKG